MSDAQTLTNLAARVGAATGPDRELDRDLWWVLDHTRARQNFHAAAMGMPRETAPTLPIPQGLGEAGVRVGAPRFTASLDAALALVERVLPKHEWMVRTVGGVAHAGLSVTEAPSIHRGTLHRSATPPLAVLAALLATLQAQEAAA